MPLSAPHPFTIDTLPGVSPAGPDTEALARWALSFDPEYALDMGTGTGYIGLCMARQGVCVDAVDVSVLAIRNVQHNAQQQGIPITTFQSSFFERVTRAYDVIVFNPPRIPGGGAASGWIGAWVRRHAWATRVALPLVRWRYGRERRHLLVTYLAQARRFVRPGGHLLLNVTRDEVPYLRAVFMALRVVELGPAGEADDTVIVDCQFTETLA